MNQTTELFHAGGYYMAMAARKIVAEPLTITGSIGVITGKFNLAELYRRAGYAKTSISKGRRVPPSCCILPLAGQGRLPGDSWPFTIRRSSAIRHDARVQTRCSVCSYCRSGAESPGCRTAARAAHVSRLVSGHGSGFGYCICLSPATATLLEPTSRLWTRTCHAHRQRTCDWVWTDSGGQSRSPTAGSRSC